MESTLFGSTWEMTETSREDRETITVIDSCNFEITLIWENWEICNSFCVYVSPRGGRQWLGDQLSTLSMTSLHVDGLHPGNSVGGSLLAGSPLIGRLRAESLNRDVRGSLRGSRRGSLRSANIWAGDVSIVNGNKFFFFILYKKWIYWHLTAFQLFVE